MTLTITLPTLPPTANHAYKQTTMRTKAGKVYAGRRLTDEAEAWRNGAALAIRAQAAALAVPAALGVRLVAQHPRVLTFDLDNRAKLALDAIKVALDYDDRYVLAIELIKQRGPEQLVIVLEALSWPDGTAPVRRSRAGGGR